jgi:hypothetical protein
VPEHLGRRLEYRCHVCQSPSEIPDQGFHQQIGLGTVKRSNRLRNVLRPTVGQIISIHHRQHHVTQTQTRHGLSHVLSLTCIDYPTWMALIDRAETATPRANFPQNHHGCRAFGPTLSNVGAMRLLAHRMKLQSTQSLLDPRVALAPRSPNLQPRRLSRLVTLAGSVCSIHAKSPLTPKLAAICQTDKS